MGYGNQGRAQALNMRDSGIRVIVGNIEDASFEMAQKDGFEVLPISEAAERGTIIFILLPDEVQPQVYESEIKPHLKPGKALVFAHGYNIHYGFLRPPKEVDILPLAPRMVGKFVRELYEKGTGAPVIFHAHQDATGRAKERVLALAKGIGATRVGAMEVTMAEETELDHFSEHFIAPIISRAIILSFEVLTEMGYTPEAVLLEIYASGEMGEVTKSMAVDGLVAQLPFHSRTSQYGQLTYAERVMPDSEKDLIRQIGREIQEGSFAREWQLEQQLGYPVFRKLLEKAFKHPINEMERTLKEKISIEIS
ncbi:MAG TPA: ketol-acid reductoisomerase [Patescibacteria group bacterium]|nr:ketol-acid reductoisomerase [Patescibacteria group bacterium]